MSAVAMNVINTVDLTERENRKAYFQPVMDGLPKAAQDVLQFVLIDHPYCTASKAMAGVFVGLVYRQKVEIFDLYQLDRDNMRKVHNLLEEACTNVSGWGNAANAVNTFHNL